MKPAFKNILVPTDFSHSNNCVIATAIELCKQHQAVMHLIHVKESRYILDNPEPGTIASEVINDIDQEARTRLYEVYESVLREHDISLQIHMPTGIPFDEICKAALEMPIDLIVIGTHGTSGKRDSFIGTTAYNVTKYAIKPVLMIPAHFEWTGFKNILFPVRPVQHLKAEYELVQPFINNPAAHIHIGLFNTFRERDNLALDNNDLPEIIAAINACGSSCTNGSYTCRNLAVKVLELSELLGSDLVVINAALEYKWTQFCLGAYTQKIISATKVPVLSFRNCVDITDEAKQEMITKEEKISRLAMASH